MYSILHELYPRFSNSQTFASRAICTCTSECPCAKRVRNRHRTPSRRIDRLRSKGREMSAKMRDFQRPCFKFFFFFLSFFFSLSFSLSTPPPSGSSATIAFHPYAIYNIPIPIPAPIRCRERGREPEPEANQSCATLPFFFPEVSIPAAYSTLLHSTPPRKKKGAVPALARSLPNTKSRSHGRCSLFNKDDGVR